MPGTGDVRGRVVIGRRTGATDIIFASGTGISVVPAWDNGCLLCRHHHTEIHREEWVIRMAADGLPEFIPPRWIDSQQKPRRNTLRKYDQV